MLPLEQQRLRAVAALGQGGKTQGERQAGKAVTQTCGEDLQRRQPGLVLAAPGALLFGLGGIQLEYGSCLEPPLQIRGAADSGEGASQRLEAALLLGQL